PAAGGCATNWITSRSCERWMNPLNTTLPCFPIIIIGCNSNPMGVWCFPIDSRRHWPIGPLPCRMFRHLRRKRMDTVFQANLLAGKKILITGGATGLGKSMGKRFLELGASLCICGRREEVLAEAADELRKATGGKVTTFPCDVRKNELVEAMIEKFWQDGPIDVLVNNAAGNFLCRTEELSIGAFEAVIGIVLMGTLHTTMACGKRWLKEGRKATVLNITTTYAENGSPYVVPASV